MGTAPASPDLDLDGDTLREECGVFGVFGHDDAAALTALGLHALQHRGQEAAGIVAFDGGRFHSERRLGLVGDSFSKPDDHRAGCRAAPPSAMSATRPPARPSCAMSSRSSPSSLPAALPLAHNGNLTNGLTLRRELVATGAICQSTSDTEVILHLVARSKKPRMVDRFIDRLRQLEGAYSLVALTNKKMIGARDPLGIRPLVLGELNGAHILCSETCALDIIGARYIRDIENGEVVGDLRGRDRVAFALPAACRRGRAFSNSSISRVPTAWSAAARSTGPQEHGRRARPRVAGRRRRGDPGAGFRASRRRSATPRPRGIPFELGIIRNHYVGRTFIEPTQQIRRARRQAEAQCQPFRDRRASRIVLVDDFDRARHHLGQDRADDV